MIYAVGDIHGRQDLLLGLLGKISQDIRETKLQTPALKNVLLIFLGDYIDRGHASKDVIETLCTPGIIDAELIFLKGNHEAAVLDFIDQPETGTRWLKFGGRETLSSYGVSIPSGIEAPDQLQKLREIFVEKLPAHHLTFLRSLELFKVELDYMFVHAGVDPTKPLIAQTESEYLWIRKPFLKSMRKLPLIIVHGHTPEPNPVWDGRRIGVDTGAYLSNKLTAVRLINGNVKFLST